MTRTANGASVHLQALFKVCLVQEVDITDPMENGYQAQTATNSARMDLVMATTDLTANGYLVQMTEKLAQVGQVLGIMDLTDSGYPVQTTEKMAGIWMQRARREVKTETEVIVTLQPEVTEVEEDINTRNSTHHIHHPHPLTFTNLSGLRLTVVVSKLYVSLYFQFFHTIMLI